MGMDSFRIENEWKGVSRSRTVRFPEALFEQLCQLAQKNDISFNLLVLQCCKYSLEHLESEEE